MATTGFACECAGVVAAMTGMTGTTWVLVGGSETTTGVVYTGDACAPWTCTGIRGNGFGTAIKPRCTLAVTGDQSVASGW